MSADGRATDAPPAAGLADALDERLAHEQLRTIAGSARRIRVSMAVVDAFFIWLLAGIGLLDISLAWVAGGLVLQSWRWSIPRDYLRGVAANPAATAATATPATLATPAVPDAARRAARRFEMVTALVGLERGLIVLPLFLQPVDVTHYVFTTVLVGQMAGAVGSMAGLVRGFVWWGLPVCVPTALAWLAQGSRLTSPVGALVLLLFGALTGAVRDNRAALRKIIALARETEDLAASLRVERDRAEAASQSKTRFFAAANHDLRQPLHALAMNAAALDLAVRRSPDAAIRELSLGIHDALAASNQLLEGLLDLSRLDAGAVPLAWRVLDARTLLASVGAEFRASAVARGLALEIEAPDGPAPLWVRVDASLALRVMNNLVSNALKFTQQGGVRLQAQAVDGRVRLRVADTGCGIPLADQARVFEEFYQVDNPSRDRSQGLGLGLAIVHRTVALLGGELALHSTPGEGTVVDVLLPAAPPPQAPGGAGGDEDDARGDPQARTGADAHDVAPLHARVLALDDDADVRRSVAGLLLQAGAGVGLAGTLAQALKLVDDGFRPDVLLVDLRLRDGTGIDAIATLRERLGPLPAVLVTGDAAPAALRGADEGRWLLAHKPVDGHRLVALLRAAAAVEAEEEAHR